jgi:hypothetical protein
MIPAWEKHYSNIGDNFVPEIYIQTADGTLMLAPWVGTYRDLMLEKYGSFDLVEPRVKFNLFMLIKAALDKNR